MNEGGDQEHALPLLPGLQREVNRTWKSRKKKQILVEKGYWMLKMHISYLMLCHGTNYKWANHPRQGAHTVGDPHKDASIARRNVQVVDIETLWGRWNAWLARLK